MNSGKVAAVVSLVQSWEQGDIRTGCVYEKYEVLVEDYMVPNVEEERQCFCNKDEFANYEQGHDPTLKNA